MRSIIIKFFSDVIIFLLTEGFELYNLKRLIEKKERLMLNASHLVSIFDISAAFRSGLGLACAIFFYISIYFLFIGL